MGTRDGSFVETVVGLSVWSLEGTSVGSLDGTMVGLVVGVCVTVGRLVGFTLGLKDGL